MKNILYMGIAHTYKSAVYVFSRSLLRSLLLSHHKVYTYGDSQFYQYFDKPNTISEEKIATINWDIVIVQNSQCFTQYSRIMRLLRKMPMIYVSNTDDINGYIAPFDNLFAVLSTGAANLMNWNIPAELCTSLNIPVIESGNHYRYDEKPDYYEMVYYPIRNSTSQIDATILSFVNFHKLVIPTRQVNH